MSDETPTPVPPVEPTPPVAATPPVEPTPPVAPAAPAAEAVQPPPIPQAPPAPPAYAAAPGYPQAPIAAQPYAPGPYGTQQAYPYAYAPPAPPSGLSITSMVLGICGVFFSFFYGFGLFPAIAALITGIMARKRQPHAKGFWLTGIITGSVGIGIAILWIVGIIVFALFVAAHANDSSFNSSDFG